MWANARQTGRPLEACEEGRDEDGVDCEAEDLGPNPTAREQSAYDHPQSRKESNLQRYRTC